MNINNKLFYVVMALTIAMLVVGVGGSLIVNRVADVVIEKLQKEYSPSPYGPGIDPDKIDVQKLKKR
jgi:hypothetical protein